jgi:hypothetical protein
VHRTTNSYFCAIEPHYGIKRKTGYEVAGLLKLGTSLGKRKSDPITGLDRPRGLQEVEAPRFQENRHMKEIFLALISFRG